MWYNISEANEYLVVTGAGIEDIRIVKKAFVYPWQKCSRISVSPFDLSLNLQAMTIEKLKFALPAVFTLGAANEPEALKKYALLLSGNPDGTSAHRAGAIAPGNRHHVHDIVKGIIEGETRVIVSSMTMEEIFKERQVFKEKVIESVQHELDQFGLRIYNANVKELQDTPGSEYFEFLSRKAHEGASNQARIDVAEARMRGEIGEAAKKGHAKQEISKIDAETAVLETQRKGDKAQADAELTNRQTELDMGVQLAQIKARRAAEARDAELQKDVETKKAETELERLRAKDLVKSKIARETAQQDADAQFYSKSKAADGSRYHEQQTAEGKYFSSLKSADAKVYTQKQEAETSLFRQTKETEATYFRQMKEADAAFYAKKKEAEGISAIADSYKHLADAFGGPQGLIQYMMIKENVYEKLALANAKAIQGLSPKITIWNTGDQNGNGGAMDALAPIRNIMTSLPPLLSTINEQTGISPPSWLMQMPQQQQGHTNGHATQDEKMKKLNGTNGFHHDSTES